MRDLNCVAFRRVSALSFDEHSFVCLTYTNNKLLVSQCHSFFKQLTASHIWLQSLIQCSWSWWSMNDKLLREFGKFVESSGRNWMLLHAKSLQLFVFLEFLVPFLHRVGWMLLLQSFQDLLILYSYLVQVFSAFVPIQWPYSEHWWRLTLRAIHDAWHFIE